MRQPMGVHSGIRGSLSRTLLVDDGLRLPHLAAGGPHHRNDGAG